MVFGIICGAVAILIIALSVIATDTDWLER